MHKLYLVAGKCCPKSSITPESSMQNGFNRLGFIAIIYEYCTCFEMQICDPYDTILDPHLCLYIHTHRTHKLLAERHRQPVRYQ